MTDLGPCVEWDGARNARGYGKRKPLHSGGTTLVHRQEFERVHGPLPAGVEVMHRCDNPPCFRLDHLQAGTHAENMADAASKGRMTNAHRDKTECVNGHPYTPENTYVRPDGYRDCMTCRRKRVAAYSRRKRLAA